MAQADTPSQDPISIMKGVSEQIITPNKDTVIISSKETTPVTTLVPEEEASDCCSPHGNNKDVSAGTNANSSTEVIIDVTATPLSELVWSPNSGLSVKYSECRLPEKISSILWSTETATMIVVPQENINDQLNANDVNDDVRQPECDLEVKSPGRGSPAVAKSPHCQLRSHVTLVDAEQHCVGAAKGAALGFLINDETGTSSAKEEKGLDDGRATNISMKKAAEYSKIPVKLKPEGYYEKFRNLNSGSVQSVSTSPLGLSESLIIKDQSFIQMPILDPIMDEDNKIIVAPASSVGFPQYHKNDDQKALVTTEIGPSCSQGKDNSNESPESSNNGGLYFTGKRACSGEPQCAAVNKKVKGQPSSFINWLSNVTNGILKVEQDGKLSLTGKSGKYLTRDSSQISNFTSANKNQATACTSTGFQKLIEDMCGPNLRLQKHRTEQGSQKTEQRDRGLCSTGNSEVKFDKDDVDPHRTSPVSNHYSSIASPLSLGCFRNQIPIVDGVASSSRVLYDTDKQNDRESEHEVAVDDQEVSPSRKLEKTPISPACPCVQESRDDDQKLKTELNPVLPSQQFRSSEGMYSPFARRLDAVKYIGPPNAGDNMVCSKFFCFFCGIEGHILMQCNHMLEPEQEDIKKKLNLSDEGEDASCFCIRCFQLNHWAIACPHLSTGKSVIGDNIHPSGRTTQQKTQL